MRGNGLVAGQPGQLGSRPDQGQKLAGCRLHADALVVGRTAAHRAQDRAVGPDEGDVSLAVPAVDGKDSCQLRHRPAAQGRNRAFSASSRSVSFSARSYCPTSGCASSAFATRSRPPRSAASRANSSYADTCAIRPLINGLTGSTATGTAPVAPMAADTSITASSDRNGSVPWLRTFTTWRSRASVTSDASSATAASE